MMFGEVEKFFFRGTQSIEIDYFFLMRSLVKM